MIKYHCILALYFNDKPLYADEPVQKKPNIRKLVEQPGQQVYGGRRKECEDTLSSFLFMKCKLEALSSQYLINDFKLFIARNSLMTGNTISPFKLIMNAILLSAHVIDADIEQFAGQLVGRLSKFKDPKIVRVVKCARTWRGSPWLCPLAPSLRPPNTILFRTLIGHKSPVKAVAINADGQYALSAENDGTLKLWNLKIGKQLRILQNSEGRRNKELPKKEKNKVNDHSANFDSNAIQLESEFRITTLIMSDNGRQALGSDGRTMKLWDVESGQEQTLTLSSSIGLELALGKDGKSVICTTSKGYLIKSWNLVDGMGLVSSECVSLDYHGERDALITGFDGTQAICALPGSREVWNLEKSLMLSKLEGFWWPDNFLDENFSFSNDGNWVVAGSKTMRLRLWEVRNGKCLCVFTGDSELLHSKFTPDGRMIIASEKSGSIHFLRIILPKDPK